MENKKPKTLSEAISHLEALSKEHAGAVGKNMDNIMEDVKKTIEDLKPYVEELETKAKAKIQDTAIKVKEKVQKDPWIVVIVIAVISFIIGILIFRNREDRWQSSGPSCAL